MYLRNVTICSDTAGLKPHSQLSSSFTTPINFRPHNKPKAQVQPEFISVWKMLKIAHVGAYRKPIALRTIGFLATGFLLMLCQTSWIWTRCGLWSNNVPLRKSMQISLFLSLPILLRRGNQKIKCDEWSEQCQLVSCKERVCMKHWDLSNVSQDITEITLLLFGFFSLPTGDKRDFPGKARCPSKALLP